MMTSGPESHLRTKLVVSVVRSRRGASTAVLSCTCWACERRMSVFVPVLGTCCHSCRGWFFCPSNHRSNRCQIVGLLSSFSLISKLSLIWQPWGSYCHTRFDRV